MSNKFPPVTEQAKASVPTDWYFLKKIFENFEFGQEHVIVDVGCGLGRSTLFLDTRYPAAEVVGVELNSDAAVFARAVVRKDCEIITGSILTHCPANANVFYLFNPFHSDMMKQFCGAILNTRPSFTLIYAVPVHLDDIREHCTGAISVNVHRVVNQLRGLDRSYAVVTKAQD